MTQVVTRSAAEPDLLHPDGQYSTPAKWFHWVTVPAIGILLLSGLTIRFIDDRVKMSFYTLHESLGLLVLALSVARLVWRVRNPPPPMPPHLPALVRNGADAVHNLLYSVLIIQPLLGFFTTNAYGFPQRDATAFLGFINLPKFMEGSPELALTLHWAHSIVGWVLIPLVLFHAGAVIYHHAIRGDRTLLRMI